MLSINFVIYFPLPIVTQQTPTPNLLFVENGKEKKIDKIPTTKNSAPRCVFPPLFTDIDLLKSIKVNEIDVKLNKFRIIGSISKNPIKYYCKIFKKKNVGAKNVQLSQCILNTTEKKNLNIIFIGIFPRTMISYACPYRNTRNKFRDLQRLQRDSCTFP